MPGSWREICPLAARFRYYDYQRFIAKERMAKPKSFLRVFTESGPLLALAVAVALLVGIVGPASAQFFNFGGPPPPQRPAPRSNGGGFGGGGGWVGGGLVAPVPARGQGPERGGGEFFKRPPAPQAGNS